MDETSHIIQTADGRKIRINEAGQPDGVPVMALRGTPQSRLLYKAWIADARARGIRLICYERPGYGKSSIQPGRTVASAAEDVAAIARELGLKRMLVWGISGGGPHALACAALLPDLIVAAAVLASPAPYPADHLDYFAGMGESNVAEGRAALQGREALTQVVEATAGELLRATPETVERGFRSLLCPPDAEALTTDFAEFVVQTVQEGIGERRDGFIDDELAFMSPWGFELEQIRIPILIMHGKQDLMVPCAHGEWLANRIPSADVCILPGDGHLTLSLHRIPSVHAWLMRKLITVDRRS